MPVQPPAYLVLVSANGPVLPCQAGVHFPPAGAIYALLFGRNALGREPGSIVELPWMVISRRHAVVENFADGSWEIEDLQSRNGTAVNGAVIPPGTLVPLHDGDRIQIPGNQQDVELLFTFQTPPLTPMTQEESVQQDGFQEYTTSTMDDHS